MIVIFKIERNMEVTKQITKTYIIMIIIYFFWDQFTIFTFLYLFWDINFVFFAK